MGIISLFISIKTVTVVIFLLILFALIIKFLFSKKSESNIIKIIGGLVVFIVAIISDNGWVFWTSLFIGGLIIASEDFMKFLVAILKTRGDKISDTVASFGATREEPATPQEDDEKKNEEFKDIVPEKEITDHANREDSHRDWIKKTRISEELVLNYYKEIFNRVIEKQIKITDENSNFIIADGILKNDIGKIITIFEIKFLRKFDPFMININIRRTLERMRFIVPSDVIISLNIVFEGDVDERSLDRIFNRLTYKNFQLILFKLKDEKINKIAQNVMRNDSVLKHSLSNTNKSFY